MFKWLSKLLEWFTGLWSKLPQETKDKIISVIVESFEEIFRAYYCLEVKKNKEQKEKNEG